jgi:membrane protease YdiL (CAAX protease family)
MRQTVIFMFIPMLVLVIITSSACLMAYWIALSFNDPSILRKLIIRCSQIFLILSIFPVSRYLGLTKEMLGYTKFKKMFKQFFQGICLSLLVLLPVFFMLYMLDVHSIDMTKEWSVAWVLKKIGIAFGLAILIGVVEESVFRGMLYSSLKKYLPALSAVLITAVYYAGLHFLDSKAPVSEETLSLKGSFGLLEQAYLNVFAMQDVSAFFALLVVGIFLGVLRSRGEMNLALCIGCHTGWVWQIRMCKSMFTVHATTPYSFLVSHYDGVIGWLVAGWLLVLLFIYWSWGQLVSKVVKL